VVALKDTSLGFIIGFQDLLRRANLSIQTTHSPIQTLLVVAAVYILINYSLGRLAEYVQRRTARDRGGAQAPKIELAADGPLVAPAPVPAPVPLPVPPVPPVRG